MRTRGPARRPAGRDRRGQRALPARGRSRRRPRRGDGLELVDGLEVSGERHLAWTRRSSARSSRRRRRLGRGVRRARRSTSRRLRARGPAPADGARAGALIRSGRDSMARSRSPPSAWRRRCGGVRDDREHDAVGRATTARPRYGAHVLLDAHGAARSATSAFVSLTDPPTRCARTPTPATTPARWPVLVGEPAARHAAVLADHPRGPPAVGARRPATCSMAARSTRCSC